MDSNDNASANRQDSALPIFEEAAKATSIDFSPFYQREKSTLPNGEKVQSGGFYFMDDSGGLIAQLYNSSQVGQTNAAGEVEQEKIFGKLDLDGDDTSVTINAGSIISAKSFKDGLPGNSGAVDHVKLVSDLKVINLINVTNERLTPPPDKQNSLTVHLGNVGQSGFSFFIYNVASENGQNTVIHTKTPTNDGLKTDTLLHGMVYVEFGGLIYIGMLQKVHLQLPDSNGFFIKNTASQVEA